jgi:hypothetical protein
MVRQLSMQVQLHNGATVHRSDGIRGDPQNLSDECTFALFIVYAKRGLAAVAADGLGPQEGAVMSFSWPT